MRKQARPGALPLDPARGSPPGPAHIRQAGFTLIELVVVLTVLALALTIVASRGPLRSRTLEARLAASQIAEQLRLARTQAIATDKATAFTLDLPARTWRIGTAPPHRIPDGTTLSMRSAADTPLPRAGTISFAPDGSSSGGRITLADTARRMTVGVDWLTGRVAVSETR